MMAVLIASSTGRGPRPQDGQIEQMLRHPASGWRAGLHHRRRCGRSSGLRLSRCGARRVCRQQICLSWQIGIVRAACGQVLFDQSRQFRRNLRRADQHLVTNDEERHADILGGNVERRPKLE
jgi:hypothetical protein